MALRIAVNQELEELESLLETAPRLVGERSLRAADDASRQVLATTIDWNGARHPIAGDGSGPIDAFVTALARLLGVPIRVGDYQEHTLGDRASAIAVAYVELAFGSGRHLYGAGSAPSIVDASFRAVLSAIGRAVERGWLVPPGAPVD